MTEAKGTEEAATEASSETVDVREQMRVALEKKQAQQKKGAAHLDGHAKADHTAGRAGGNREFRRKSGG